MNNKCKIQLDVTQREVDLLCKSLSFAAERAPADLDELDALEAKVALAWIERTSDEADEAHTQWRYAQDA